jgi:hypothetical protein
MLLNFLLHLHTFKSIFMPKQFPEETWPKIYLDQDPDPDVLKSRIRILSKIVRIRNTGYVERLSKKLRWP